MSDLTICDGGSLLGYRFCEDKHVTWHSRKKIAKIDTASSNGSLEWLFHHAFGGNVRSLDALLLIRHDE